MTKETEYICDKNLIEFLDSFDPIYEKYGVESKKNNKLYRTLIETESKNQFNKIMTRDYGDVRKGLDLVYGKHAKNNNLVEIYKNTSRKILNYYIAIDGMEHLFSPDYFNFEWEMHLGADFKKNSMNYYRDHFIHEVRNYYESYILLKNCGLEQVMMETIKRKGNLSSSYIMKQVVLQVDCINNSISTSKIMNDCFNYHNKNSIGLDKTTDQTQFLKDYILKYIINASTVVACLFHDIGYPLAHVLKEGERLVRYVSGFYAFVEDGSSGFNKISAMIENSLLYKLNRREEIRKRFLKKEHGVLSAISFLMQFYENGSIFGLEPMKRAVIELAALAMYNHDIKYMFSKGSEAEDYYRLLFEKNPISFLLRIADDLQEWERTYFEITDTSGLQLCSQCNTPRVRISDENGKIFFRCLCRKIEEKNNYNGFDSRLMEFENRNITSIVVCKDLVVRGPDDKGENRILLYLRFDLFKQLQMSLLSPQYAFIRCKEMNVLKKNFSFQGDNLKTPYLKYTLSSNPIYLKIAILEEYFEIMSLSETNTSLKNEIQTLDRDIVRIKKLGLIIDLKNIKMLNTKIIDELDITKTRMDILLKLLRKHYKNDEIKDILEPKISLYLKLMNLGILQKCVRDKMIEEKISEEDRKNDNSELIETFLKIPEIANQPQIVRLLIKDYFEQNNKVFGFQDGKTALSSKAYYEQYEVEKTFIKNVEIYCDGNEQEANLIKDSSLDFYWDLYLFNQINEANNQKFRNARHDKIDLFEQYI